MKSGPEEYADRIPFGRSKRLTRRRPTPRNWASMLATSMMARIMAPAAFLFAALAGLCQQGAPGQPSEDRGELAAIFGSGNAVRGEVTAIPAGDAVNGSFTIRTDQGQSYKIFYSPNTRIVKERQPVKPGIVKVGDMLLAAGQVNQKSGTVGAVFLVDVDAEKVRAARAAFGKTWTAGKVTAVHDLQITIERAGDKVTQVIAVDENTSFRKRREDVTLGDIQVGEMVSAQGTLNGNVFLATTVRVMDPPSGGFQGGSGGGPGAPGETP